MGRKHDVLVDILTRQSQKLRLKKGVTSVFQDALFKNKHTFRRKSCDILFLYKGLGIPLEVKKKASPEHRKEAITDLLNGTFYLELASKLHVPYGFFIVYKVENTDQYFAKQGLPFAKEIKKYTPFTSSLNLQHDSFPLAWFTKIDGKPLYVERIPRIELQAFPLIDALRESKKNGVNYTIAKRSMKKFSKKTE